MSMNYACIKPMNIRIEHCRPLLCTCLFSIPLMWYSQRACVAEITCWLSMNHTATTYKWCGLIMEHILYRKLHSRRMRLLVELLVGVLGLTLRYTIWKHWGKKHGGDGGEGGAASFYSSVYEQEYRQTALVWSLLSMLQHHGQLLTN